VGAGVKEPSVEGVEEGVENDEDGGENEGDGRLEGRGGW